MSSVELLLIDELKKRIEILEQKVNMPMAVLGIDYAENEKRKLKHVWPQVEVDAGLREIAEDRIKPGSIIKPPLGRAPAEAFTTAEGQWWHPLSKLREMRNPQVFAIKFMDGWIWDCIVGWRRDEE